MKEIVTYSVQIKKAKMNPSEKKKTKKYWQLLYGPDYAEEMVFEPIVKPHSKENK